jgi:HK97 gp10 family phage protein
MAKLVSRLSFIAAGADKAVAAALEDTANFILTLIRAYAPVDTGALRDSYEIEKVSPLYIIIGSMLNYSIFQELGTSRMAASPHVLPAFLQGEDFFRNALIQRINEIIG